MRKFLLLFLFVIPLALSACMPDAPETVMEADQAVEPSPEPVMEEESHDEMAESSDEVMAEEETPAEEMAESEEMAVDTPAWFDYPFTDPRTGTVFAINDFSGKVVLVETMAQWCSNCKRQQQQVQTLQGMIGDNPDFVFIALDIDPNEDAASLKAYAEANGFDWLYGIPDVNVLREISELYGDQFLNPPSTPMFIIDQNGEVHLLEMGVKSADTLLAALTPFLEG